MSQNVNGYGDLKGRSFIGQDLAGADFSCADLRGVNFAQANLTGANFSNVKAGQQFLWLVGLLSGMLISAVLAGFIAAYAGALISSLMVHTETQPVEFWSGLIAISILIALGLIAIRKGLGAALSSFTITVAIAIAVIAAIGKAEVIGPLVVQSLGIAFALAATILGGMVISIVWLIAKRAVPIAIGASVIGAIPGALAGVEGSEAKVVSLALIIAATITVGLICLTTYLGWRGTIGDDQRFSLIHRVAAWVATSRGTNFRKANLTDANFTEASLKSTDFRDADLTRTCWLGAKKLSRARLTGIYLEDPTVRQLAVTKDGRDKNYDRFDLRGLNLTEAKLQNASFISADFSEANLRNSDLSGAKLVQAQLYQTDLTGANLTGAYIQNWGISVDTKLDGVKCDYIYMQLPTKDDPDPCRKPDNRNETFETGDFADFIAPIIKTLDLYRTQNLDLRKMASTFKTLDLFHHKGIDPAAVTIALQQVAEEYPEAGLEIVALEGRGNQKIRLQAVVAEEADRSEISTEYFERYERIKSLPYKDLQALLAGVVEKDDRIRSLEKLLENALQQPKFYVETAINPAEPVKSILMLAANPKGTTALRLGEEARQLQNGLERSRYRDRFALDQRWAITATDVRRALLDCKPSIVHFSGHGMGTDLSESQLLPDSRKLNAVPQNAAVEEGLIFENEIGQPQLISTEALADLFALFANHVECVVLNACYSENQANAISRHIPYVVGLAGGQRSQNIDRARSMARRPFL